MAALWRAFQITGFNPVDEFRESRLSGSLDEVLVSRVAIKVQGFEVSADGAADNSDPGVLVSSVPVINLLEIWQPRLERPP